MTGRRSAERGPAARLTSCRAPAPAATGSSRSCSAGTTWPGRSLGRAAPRCHHSRPSAPRPRPLPSAAARGAGGKGARREGEWRAPDAARAPEAARAPPGIPRARAEGGRPGNAGRLGAAGRCRAARATAVPAAAGPEPGGTQVPGGSPGQVLPSAARA